MLVHSNNNQSNIQYTKKMHQKGAVSTLKDLYIIYEKIKISISFTCNYLQKYHYILSD